jgi:hypothetical protein
VELPGKISLTPQRVQLIGIAEDLDRLLDELHGRREDFRALNLGFAGVELDGIRIRLDEFGVQARDPGIAIIGVPPGHDAAHLAHLLQVDLLRLGRNIAVEPSFVAAIAATTPPWAMRAPQANPKRLPQAIEDVKNRIAGRRRRNVVVVDTGTSDRTTTMLDMTSGQPSVGPGVDLNGHGSVMQQLVRAVNPDAQIVAARVLQNAQGEAWPTIAALIALVWGNVLVTPGVISMSVVFPPLSGCVTTLGATLTWLLAQTPPLGGWPVFVSAAGNAGANVALPYPAAMAMPTAIVVGSWDWAAQPAAYSGPAGRSNSPAWAYGGVNGDPVVQTTNDSKVRSWFGTSVATALVAGALSR